MNQLHPGLKRLMRAARPESSLERPEAPAGFAAAVVRRRRSSEPEVSEGTFAQWLIFRAATASAVLIVAGLAAQVAFTARPAAPYDFTGAYTAAIKVFVP
jgi:hypothetical protein